MSVIRFAFTPENTYYPACREDADVAILGMCVIGKLVEFMDSNIHLPSDKMETFLSNQFEFDCVNKKIKIETKSLKDFKIHSDMYISHDYRYTKEDIEKIHKIANNMIDRRLYDYLDNFKKYHFCESVVINRPSVNIRKPIVPQPHPR